MLSSLISLGTSGSGEASRAYGSLIDGETEVRDAAVREKMRRVWTLRQTGL